MSTVSEVIDKWSKKAAPIEDVKETHTVDIVIVGADWVAWLQRPKLPN